VATILLLKPNGEFIRKFGNIMTKFEVNQTIIIKKTTGNNRLAKVAVQCPVRQFVVKQTVVLHQFWYKSPPFKRENFSRH
jgi:hypothetical protein